VKLALLRTAVRQSFLPPRPTLEALIEANFLESGCLSFGSDVGPFVDFNLKVGTTAVLPRRQLLLPAWAEKASYFTRSVYELE
jgi:hypothetical protein